MPFAHPPSAFLSLPVEIRLKIYTLLFLCTDTLLIEPTNPKHRQDLEDESVFPPEYLFHPEKIPTTLRMSPIQFCRPAYLTRPLSTNNYGLGLSSQLLLVCQQICAEAMPILYSINRFDCSMRSAPIILLRVVATANFAHIRHLILDWEQLEDFAWSLVQADQVYATRGLEVLELNHFRTRVLKRRVRDVRMGIMPNPARPRDSVWENLVHEPTKSYERILYQAALKICQKHATLSHVLEAVLEETLPRAYQCEEVPPRNGHGLSRPIPELKLMARIRWRFVTEKTLRGRRDNEHVLDLTSELEALGDPDE